MAAYRDGDEWLDECRDYIDGNIEYVKNFVKEQMPRAHYIDCEGTYLVWLDLSGYGFERINVACPRSYVETCMNSIKDALETKFFKRLVL